MWSESMRILAYVLTLLLPLSIAAHGLLLDAESDGATIWGSLYYSSGELAVFESIELLDLTTPGATPVQSKTDENGKFSFPVTASNRYRVSAYGEEGHSVEVELVATPKAKPQLIENEAASEEASGLPPAWALIGGGLLLSLITALLWRKRAAARS